MAILPPFNPATANITSQLASALGIPKGATRAVLTLQVGELPQLDVEMFPGFGYATLGADHEAVAAVPFMLRMRFEPFD